jgi:Trypsin
MLELVRRLVVIGLASLVAGRAPGGEEASMRETPGLRATQVTVALDRNRSRRLFRATVMARTDDTLTILTAAHCLSEDDRDGPALLMLGGETLEGTVQSVVRNPSYRANNAREVPGPDSAVARLRFEAGKRAEGSAYRALRPAPALATRSYPGPGGQTVSVRMIDAHGVEHAVRAGNYSNPRWLEWGPAYKPIPGDSGGGVFVVREGPDGEVRPILIGIIVGRDDRGGGASLVSLEQRWLADALPR